MELTLSLATRHNGSMRFPMPVGGTPPLLLSVVLILSSEALSVLPKRPEHPRAAWMDSLQHDARLCRSGDCDEATAARLSRHLKLWTRTEGSILKHTVPDLEYLGFELREAIHRRLALGDARMVTAVADWLLHCPHEVFLNRADLEGALWRALEEQTRSALAGMVALDFEQQETLRLELLAAPPRSRLEAVSQALSRCTPPPAALDLRDRWLQDLR